MKSRMRRRVIPALIILPAIIVGAGSVWYFSRPAAAKAQQCETMRAAIRARGSIVHVADGAPVTGILGDSYAAGDEIPDRTKGWVYDLKGQIPGAILVDGVGATGFVNGGYCENDTYAVRLPRLLDEHPTTLIIEGGLNDVYATPRDVELAAKRLLQRVESVPKVVIIGPVDAPGRDGEAAVDAALKKAADSMNRRYVSALSWKLEFLPDKTHLTEAGHAAYAANVADAIKR